MDQAILCYESILSHTANNLMMECWSVGERGTLHETKEGGHACRNFQSKNKEIFGLNMLLIECTDPLECLQLRHQTGE